MSEESLKQAVDIDEHNALKARVDRIEKALATTIAWNVREYGEAGVKQLISEIYPTPQDGEG